MKTCKNCGFVFEDSVQVCENCGEAMQAQEDGASLEPKKSKKNVFTVAGVITTLFVVIVGRFFGGFIGETLVDGLGEKRAINQIDAFIESMEEYVPGSFDDEKYISTHFGFQFKTTDKWKMYSKADVETFSNGLKESSLASALKSLEEADVSEELIKKWKDAFYAETEMGATYIQNETVTGEVNVSVISCFGVDQLPSDQIIEEMKKGFMSMANNARSGKDTIAGEEYDYVTMSVTADGMNLVNKFYVKEKDGMIGMIFCRAVEGYEDEVFDSFKECTSKLN